MESVKDVILYLSTEESTSLTIKRTTRKNTKYKPKEKPKGKRSFFEVDVHKKLNKRFKVVEYETEKLAYTLEKVYIPDFIVYDKYGNKIYIEAKGRFTSSDRTKMLRVKENNPDKDIRLLFMQDNYLTKRKIKRYTQWADENGFINSVFPNLPI